MSWFEERWERRYQEMRWTQEFPAESTPRPRAEPQPRPVRDAGPPRPAQPPRPPKAPRERRALRLRPAVKRPVGRKAEVVPEPIPNPRRSLPAELTGRLVDRWCTASVAAGWATPGYWWNVNVDAVVDAILDDDDHVPPCVDLNAA